MILRVFHGLPAPGGEEALVAAMREHAVPTLRRLPELTGFQLGVRRTGATEIVIVTTWTTFDAILASGDPTVDAPRSIGGAPGFFVASHADHYELVLGGEDAGGPIPGASMRVTTVTIRPGHEAAYFETSRQVAAGLVAARGLVRLWVGRRSVADHTEVCAVTVWRPRADRAGEGPAEEAIIDGAEDLAAFYAAPPSPRLFEPVILAGDALG